MKKLLFVCLGNICRSPAAEGIMQALIEQHGLQASVSCDSAGTSAFHQGEPADSRMRSHAQKRGYDLTSRARQFTARDFEQFDYIFAMDEANFENICLLDTNERFQDKVFRMTAFCQEKTATEVPDPYYGGSAGFENVLDILEDACQGIKQQLLTAE